MGNFRKVNTKFIVIISKIKHLNTQLELTFLDSYFFQSNKFPQILLLPDSKIIMPENNPKDFSHYSFCYRSDQVCLLSFAMSHLTDVLPVVIELEQQEDAAADNQQR